MNIEFAAAVPEERLGVVAHAGLTAGDAFGFAGLRDAGANSHAMQRDAMDVIIASVEATVGVYTDIAHDSPAAQISLMTAGTELPPDLSAFAQLATGFSNPGASAYAASLSALSALDSFDYLNPLAIDWVIEVLPSAGETAGTPTRIQIDSVVEGLLSTAGNSVANASWLVAIDGGTPLLLGTAAGGAGIILPFGAAASDVLVLPLGSSFELRFLWTLSVSGSATGSSQAEFTTARINISATLIPEPGSLLLVAIGLAGSAARKEAWRRKIRRV